MYIHKANKKEIEATLGKKQVKQRGLYQTHALTQDQKLHIARYASIHGTAAAICVSKKDMPDVDFKDSIMWTWRDHYQAELKKCGRDQAESDKIAVKEMPSKERGRPVLLGNELDQQVQAYLVKLRESGHAVNSSIVLA